MAEYNLIRRFFTLRALAVILFLCSLVAYYGLFRVGLNTGGRAELVRRSPLLVRVTNWVDNLLYFHTAPGQASGAAEYSLTLSPEHYESWKLGSGRIPGTLVAKNKTHPVTVELTMTDPANYYFFPSKKSLVVHFNEEKTSLYFDLPTGERFFEPETNYRRARRLKLPVPKSGWATVSINGRAPNIYWLTENAPKGFPKNAVAIDEQDEQLKNLYKLISSAPPVDGAANEVFNLIDQDLVYSWIIYSALANASFEPTAWFQRANGRLLFYPGLIGNNNLPEFSSDTQIAFASLDPLSQSVLADSSARQELFKRLVAYLGDFQSVETEELQEFDQAVAKVRSAFLADPVRFYSDRDFDSLVKAERDTLTRRYAFFKKVFIPDVTAIAAVGPDGHDFSLDIKAKALAPVILESIDLSVATATPVTFEARRAEKIACRAAQAGGQPGVGTALCTGVVISPKLDVFTPPEAPAMRVYRAGSVSTGLVLITNQPLPITAVRALNLHMVNSAPRVEIPFPPVSLVERR